MAGNLEFIKSASGTSVSSLSVTDCFSANYDVYYFALAVTNQSTGTANIEARLLDSGGSEVSTSTYDLAGLDLNSYTTFAEVRLTSQTSYKNLTISDNDNPQEDGNAGFYVFNPYDSSSYTFITNQSAMIIESGGVTNRFRGRKSIYVEKTAQTNTGLKFIPTIGNCDINVSVYGLASK